MVNIGIRVKKIQKAKDVVHSIDPVIFVVFMHHEKSNKKNNQQGKGGGKQSGKGWKKFFI